MAQGKANSQAAQQDEMMGIIALHSCNQYRWCMKCKTLVNDPALHVAEQLYQAGCRIRA